MKKVILSILLLCCTIISAQDKKSLEEGANKMVQLMNAGDFEKMMDYTYPKVFTVAPREQISKVFKDALKGEGFTVTIVQSPPNFKFGEIKKIDNSSYSIVDHDLNLNMVFDEPIPDVALEETLAAFKKAMVTNDVSYDKRTLTIKVKKRAQMLAIADELTKNQWKYLNNDGGPLMGMMIPEKHMVALGLK